MSLSVARKARVLQRKHERMASLTREGKCRVAFVSFVAILFISSDCMHLFGQGVYNLKYVALVCIAVYALIKCIRRRIPVVKLLATLIGLALLVICIPFQTGQFSHLQALGLYALVFICATFSSYILESPEELVWTGIICMLFVVGLLLLSFEECVNQFLFYVRLGRPRLRGCFSNPNSLGGIASLLIIMISSGYYLARVKQRALLFVPLVILGTVVVLSGSRTSLAMVMVFAAMLLYLVLSRKARSAAMKVLLMLGLMLILVVALTIVVRHLDDDVTFMMRFNTLASISIGDLQSLVGIGYVSSAGVSSITAAAGGAVDMLWVSLYYKVGLVGIAAYLIILWGSARPVDAPRGPRSTCLLIAFVFALLMQTAGESYLSSVMSFVSCCEWIMLGLLGGGLLERADASEEPGL